MNFVGRLAKGVKEQRSITQMKRPDFAATWVDAKGEIRTFGSKAEFRKQQKARYGEDYVLYGEAAENEQQPNAEKSDDLLKAEQEKVVLVYVVRRALVLIVVSNV